MATWKKLTRGGEPVCVNMEQVCFMMPHDKGGTEVYFGAQAVAPEFIIVTEEQDEIMLAPAVRFNAGVRSSEE